MICTWGYERQSNDKHKKKTASTAERSKMGLRIRKYKFAQQLLYENINLLNNNIKIYLLNNKIKKRRPGKDTPRQSLKYVQGRH